MNKRLGAAFVAAASTVSVLTVGGGTASAAPSPCGVYPPGNAYGLSRAPLSASAHKGALIGTRGTLRRGGQSCVGFTLGFYTHTPKQGPAYTLKGGKATDGTGSVRNSIQLLVTTRYFYNLNLGGGASVRSGISEIIAR